MAGVLAAAVPAASVRSGGRRWSVVLAALFIAMIPAAAVAQEAMPRPIELGGKLLNRDTAPAFRIPLPAVPIGPVGRWFGQDAYPVAALRAGDQGRVVAILAVDAKGKPASCAVATSSGSASLDAQTCTIAMARLTFTPARNTAGRAVVGQYRLPVRWVLPAPVMTTPLNLSVETQIRVTTDGSVESCETNPTLPPGTPGPCLSWPVGRKVMVPPQRDGKAVKARIIVSMDIVTTLDP